MALLGSFSSHHYEVPKKGVPASLREAWRSPLNHPVTAFLPWLGALLSKGQTQGAGTSVSSVTVQRPEGIRTYAVRIESVHDITKQNAGLIVRLTDTTHLAETEHQLLLSTAALEAKNRELKKAHKQVVQQEKMASVGVLSAGIAHEINNPIAFISSNLQVMEKSQHRLVSVFQALEGTQDWWSKTGETKERLGLLLADYREMLAECREGVQRVQTIVSHLNRFAHRSTEELEELSLEDPLDHALALLSYEVKHKVIVSKQVQGTPRIQGNAQELTQIFMNLLLNGIQASPPNGELRVKLAEIHRHAVVNIQDEGHGMSKEILDQAFEPFFTTKPPGMGTGLGLSIVYDLVKKNAGDIAIHSEEGAGTTVILTFPLLEAVSELEE
jgi:signal transduction histidine kinase